MLNNTEVGHENTRLKQCNFIRSTVFLESNPVMHRPSQDLGDESFNKSNRKKGEDMGSNNMNSNKNKKSPPLFKYTHCLAHLGSWMDGQIDGWMDDRDLVIDR